MGKILLGVLGPLSLLVPRMCELVSNCETQLTLSDSACDKRHFEAVLPVE